jgi:hypothetical protein
MEEYVKRRIAELEQAEKETHMQLMAIRAVLGEFRAALHAGEVLDGGSEPATAHVNGVGVGG